MRLSTERDYTIFSFRQKEIINLCDVSYADHLRLEHIDTYNPMLEHIVRATNWLCKLEKVKKSKICTTSAKVQYLTNIYWTS